MLSKTTIAVSKIQNIFFSQNQIRTGNHLPIADKLAISIGAQFILRFNILSQKGIII